MRRLGGSWNAAIHAAQRSIEADTAWTGRTRGMLLRAWLRPTARGLSLSRYLRRMPGDDLLAVDEHQRRLNTWAAGNVEIEQARETLSRIEESPWRDAAGDRRGAVRGAAGRDAGLSAWTVDGGRPALKLSSDKGNSMTALERLLIRTWRRLSERSAARVPSGFAIEGSVHAL